jgi:hypothetical protein
MAEQPVYETTMDPEQESPAAPEAAAASTRKVTLDDILDIADLPPSLRGQPLSRLIADRNAAWNKVQEIGYEKNSYKAKAETFEKVLERVAPNKGEEREAPTPKPSEVLRARGLTPADDAFTDATVQLAEERMLPKFQTEINKTRQELADFKTDALNEKRRSAYWTAKPADVSAEQWQRDADLLAFIVVDQKLEDTNPQSYAIAHQRLQERMGQPSQQATTPTLAPPLPVGNARTAAVVPDAQPKLRLSQHTKGAFDRVAQIFGTDTDAIMKLVNDDPKTRRAFE